ncbi:MAG: serine O-acetyltransferase [Clostridia bacterium]|nr:serine O-acetyltransferase [Clostridia bacterium]
MFKSLRYDVKSIMERDPAAKSPLTVFFLYSGLHAVHFHRFSHWLYKHKRFFLARFISQFARLVTGIEIHPGATIGRGLLIDHGSGVVIGETAIIGDNCTIYQGVTLGGTGKETGKRHPTIGNNVLIGAGAKVLGSFKVGDNSVIAANSVVLHEVPENCTCVGAPARVKKINGQRVGDIDWASTPDLIGQEFSRLQAEIEQLRAEMEDLQGMRR